MNENIRQDSHEEICLLLPWYLNDTLERSERELVRHHLIECAECKAQLSLLSSVQTATQRNSPAPIVPVPDVGKLFAAIDRQDEVSNPAPATWRRSLVAASLAASLVVALVSGIYWVASPESPTRFSTATSDAAVTGMDYVLDVNFAAAADPDTREQFFRDIGARDVIETGRGKHYQLTVNLPMTSLEDLQNYTEELESQPMVLSVEIVALQLPVRGSD